MTSDPCRVRSLAGIFAEHDPASPEGGPKPARAASARTRTCRGPAVPRSCSIQSVHMAVRVRPFPFNEDRSRIRKDHCRRTYGSPTTGRFSSLHVFVCRKYFQGKNLSDKEIRAIYEDWGQWRY
jgi:hypothetical protein